MERQTAIPLITGRPIFSKRKRLEPEYFQRILYESLQIPIRFMYSRIINKDTSSITAALQS